MSKAAEAAETGKTRGNAVCTGEAIAAGADAAAARTETVETDEVVPEGVERRAKKLAAASTPKSLEGAEVLPEAGKSGGKANELDGGGMGLDPEG
jgi:hypothetical protein